MCNCNYKCVCKPKRTETWRVGLPDRKAREFTPKTLNSFFATRLGKFKTPAICEKIFWLPDIPP